jgi:putative glycosyltransferase (TIGR04348 family)
MRVAIVCPAPAGSRLGNRITAERWLRLLRELGHDAEIVGELPDRPFDVLVALHAGKSAAAVESARARWPELPIVVALTGTDLYRDIHVDDAARTTLDLADRLVVLHDLAACDVPPNAKDKVRVIRQSAEAPAQAPAPPISGVGVEVDSVFDVDSGFEVAFVAHARLEKDPLRAALAARALPSSSKIRIVHAGRALSTDMEALLVREARENERYTWLGEIAPAAAMALIARAKLLALTSEIEGGANVLGEAIVARTPPIASRIPACVAALGEDYPGLFPVHDTASLTELFVRAETDRAFYEELLFRCDARRDLFLPSAERDAWRGLLRELERDASRAIVT